MNTRVWWIAAAATVALAALGSPAAAGRVEPGGNGRPVPASLRCDHVVDADSLVAHLARGGRFLCSGITVQGAVDLTAIGVVQGVVACRGCTFTGRVDGQHVVFERELDLVETTFARDVDFGGAHFEQPVLFGVAATTDRCGALVETGVQPPPEFRRSADFAYATFDDLAVFEGMRFLGKANFTSSRFRAVARIGNAGFCGAASFADASFSREAVFSHATFARVDFAGAVFARPADFRQATFGPTADFSETTFAGRADFSQISVPGSASFASAHFGAGAYFEQVRLGRIVAADWPALAAPVRGPRPLLVFEDASVDGPLTLKGAELFGGVRLNSISARAIVIEQAEFDSRSALFMSDVTAAALSISPDDLAQHLRAPAAAERLAALRMVEATAKTDGNLGRANDARYQIQVLESADDWWPQRVGDAALYRWVAGYFVQPLRPVVWLVVAILVAASLRAVHRQAEDAEQPRKPGRVARAAGRFAAELAYTITPGGDKDQKPPLRRAELTVYAVLLGCFVLSLANTNPTLRQMVEGLL
jgi:uncharacterized protein YjbI with pentapeptide repeats